MYKVAVVGSRHFTDRDYIYKTLDAYHEKHGILWLISGGAQGTDQIAEQWGRDRQVEAVLSFPAQWDKLGRSAGPVRNQKIVSWCNVLIAFLKDNSIGTANSITKARDAGKKVYIMRV